MPIELVVGDPDSLLALGQPDDVLDVLGSSAGFDEPESRHGLLFIGESCEFPPKLVAESLGFLNGRRTVIELPPPAVPIDPLLPCVDVPNPTAALGGEPAGKPDVVERGLPCQIKR